MSNKKLKVLIVGGGHTGKSSLAYEIAKLLAKSAGSVIVTDPDQEYIAKLPADVDVLNNLMGVDVEIQTYHTPKDVRLDSINVYAQSVAAGELENVLANISKCRLKLAVTDADGVSLAKWRASIEESKTKLHELGYPADKIAIL